ncbi:putative hexose transport-related protein [Cutaneotrichosporon oleaginosum]|uniref:Putative hexose transport-related protein n=1 Tax=Cutaneotrichosporon oleaginosum TaxID=879819 RepID=A0A0J0XRL2_9TREE|nr:putative hexose transport-related protein [Cutaneotrichosporon oleaginosum]KLT43733.1 putative hexose transport-related protein [Cutaneotrichosporon oleaginosum]
MPASLVASHLLSRSPQPSMQQDWHTIPNARDSTPWHRDKGRLKLNFFISIIYVGMVLNGYDGMLISGLQAFDSWHNDIGLTEDNPNYAALLGLLNAAGPLSAFAIGPVITYIDQNWGRRWGLRCELVYGYTILFGTVLSCVAGIPSLAGNKGYTVFIIGRFVMGFGLGSFLITSLILVQEITHPRTRSLIAGAWNSFWILGSVIIAWVNFGTSHMTSSWGWRIPYLLQIPMAFYILIAVQFVPETPRFLIGKGRDDAAFDFLVEYHGNGDREDPLVLFEYDEMRAAIEKERLAKAEKWSVILRGRSNRHRLGLAALMTFLTQMSGASIIYYYYTIVFELVGITDPTVQTGIAAGLSMFTWCTQIAGVWSMKYIGRKRIILGVWPTLLLSLVGLCVAGGMFDRSGSTDTKSGVATVVLVWIYLGAYNYANPVLWSYPAEVQTFSMRSKGLLVWNCFTQVQAIYCVFVDSIALNSIGYKYYAVYMPLVIIQWFLVKYYMVETRGYTLEEVALAFDNASFSSLPIADHGGEMAKSDELQPNKV